ncbi:MAG: chemosensory pili system protein ChpA (sensor histidine kinase/response regulator) [Lentisphaeria bacterium]|jgi:chemosensory pili system protein ChpA (sensor histidine kinase/response regulator)
MGDKRNFAALEWVIGEISDTLREARYSLEAYVEDPKDTTRLRFCLTHIHQVQGSLLMVEFHGAALLAEEMEQTAQAILNNAVSNMPEAHEVLMRALLQLPIFLDHVKTTKDDNPAVILPLLNDMRAVRKESYLSETNLFSPDLSPLKTVSGPRHAVLNDEQKLRRVLKKLREMYQFAAASVLRGIKVDENLDYLDKVLTRLELLTRGTVCHPTWEISAALIDGLKLDEIELTVAVRGLLRYIARELRILGDKTPQTLNAMPKEGLLKNLLYYVAQAEESRHNQEKSQRVASVKSKYKLQAALFGAHDTRGKGRSTDGILQSPDPEAIKSVVVALQDELSNIKHVLDLSLTGRGSIDDLKEVMPTVKRVADTLAVLGIGNLRKQMIEQSESLERISEANSIDETALMLVAQKIIEIEQRLHAIGKSAGKRPDLDAVTEREVEIDSAKLAVIRECINGLERAKESIVEYISSQWDKKHLENVGELMAKIYGGLHMIPLDRSSNIIKACSRFIEEQLLGTEQQPNFTVLEALADAIASIEYYLERLTENMHVDADSLLDVAEESVMSLGYKVESIIPTAQVNADTAALAYVEPRETFSTPSSVEIPVEVEKSDSAFADNADEHVLEQAPETAVAQDVAALGESVKDEGLQVETELQPLENIKVNEPGTLAKQEVASPDTGAEIESDIDDEIIEIFIQEAGEVLETLAEHFPKWRAAASDTDSLVIVRRAFHTLKGSGRMVEANDIGELAWSIENMLNRLIDRSIRLKPQVHNIIEAVLELVPYLVEAFEARKANPHLELTGKYAAWARAISEGNYPDELTEPLKPAFVESCSVPIQDDTLELSSDAASFTEQELLLESQSYGNFDTSESEDDKGNDTVLQEIFSSEAMLHLETIEQYISEMEREAPLYTMPSDALQRALHTLKGSAKMAQVWPIAEITEPLEHFAKELISYQVAINDDVLQLIRDAVVYIRYGLDQIGSGKEVEIPKTEQFVARTEELRELAVGHLIRLRDAAKDGRHQVDPRMLSLVMAEEMALLLDADQLLNRWKVTGCHVAELDELLKELTVLEEGARQANLYAMEKLSALLKQLHESAIAQAQPPTPELFDVLHLGHEGLLDMVDAVAAGQNALPPPETLMTKLAHALKSLVPASEPLQYNQIAEQDEADSIDDEAIDYGNIPTIDTSESEFDTDSIVYEESFANEEPLAGEEPSTDEQPSASEGPLFIDEVSINEDSAQADLAGELKALDTFHDVPEIMQGSEAHSEDAGPPFESAAAEDSHFGQELDLTDEKSVEIEAHNLGENDRSASGGSGDAETTSPTASIPIKVEKPTPVSSQIDIIDTSHEDYDEDILEIFLEEAQELSEELDEAIHRWQSNWSDTDSVDAITRVLHTLKGGARLAGLNNMGQLTHEYESYLLGVDYSDIDEHFFNQIHKYQDQVLRAVRAIKSFLDGDEVVQEPVVQEPVVQEPVAEPYTEESTDWLEEEKEQAFPALSETSDAVASEEGQPDQQDIDRSNVVKFKAKPREIPRAISVRSDGGDFEMPSVSGGGQASPVAMKKSGPQEVVKVSAELLEELVNLAGETSISRSRLEQQISDFSFSLDEVDSTLHRLQEQLRRLDIETEAQVIFRQEQMQAHEEFDPLEMDRYSHLQQLSRSLNESASDLVDLKTDLNDKLKDTETLLLQQSRINTNLQEGLMRSRMVPFSRLVPRLRRIVRQVASELGKEVSFELDNIEGELDRSVLERMVAPFEHMLRNAVDHGIEMPEARIAAGKPESGRIVLALGREGGDVLIRLADDGRGIDLKRVREKAIERELMSSEADLSDHDIMQFILHAGFSTADNVTQISGRGVGMDVVYAEIKQLGGAVTINSSWGKGTEFVVRLPFTLSVNRALMVVIGGDNYAVPLSSIEGIVRVSPFELEHYYSNPEAQFEYAGENYHVRYLGGLLSTGTKPKLEGQTLPLPVLLVRSAEHTMALQVDRLMGSREIVVKSLGQQFSSVFGLSGATVMGDGSVVVIIDPHALVRQEIARAAFQLEQGQEGGSLIAPQRVERIKTIMVVDDSVTVRKVTTRFLEREGFDVITAKDGVDALRVLQEDLPDLMLLDIEMPRMDGFEVAKTVRSTKRWQHLPIIMITSRTGDKHREHALSLGVDRYLGKPYQEDLLLESMNELLEKEHVH